ncbi:putative Clan SC, family S9, unassigned serine peptidase [Blattamonas nauphoetae]|uniref:Clan SC, family S9, unassigned serine peptidase n=1 Tax=Blattamonas nauphoetae TaxID=2049346 RepID=A0ABQ9XDK5_9EUKA|nr:putative Clan SC, family S9, unassigned serine peptidase [Blattamonas nauphoetae]
MPSINELVEMGAEMVIRPPRYIYTDQELGPSDGFLDDTSFYRDDFTVHNADNQILHGCIFFPGSRNDTPKPNTCIIYCHGNAGNLLDCLQICVEYLRRGLAVCGFDFSGCGLSDGKYITVGCREVQDVDAVHTYLQKSYSFDHIVLWGRSMGAAVTIQQASLHPGRFVCCVADSPFARMMDVVDAMAEVMKNQFCGGFIVIPIGKSLIRSRIKKLTGMDIKHYSPIDVISDTSTPLFIAHSPDDNLIPFKQAELLFNKYVSPDRELYHLSGDHNSERTRQFFDTVFSFIESHAQIGFQVRPKTEENPLLAKYASTLERPQHSPLS